MSITYNGYELEASSYDLSEKQEWDSRVTITKLQDKDVKRHTHTFTLVSTFNTKDKAIENAYTVAKEVVDGIHILNSLSKTVSNCQDLWLLAE